MINSAPRLLLLHDFRTCIQFLFSYLLIHDARHAGGSSVFDEDNVRINHSTELEAKKSGPTCHTNPRRNIKRVAAAARRLVHNT